MKAKVWTPSLIVPEEVKAWKNYADPINKHISDKWKNGEPLTKDRVVKPEPIAIQARRIEQEPHPSYRWEAI